MPTGPEPTRQYSDREVRLILKSAVDLQARADRGSDSSGGMSLAEIEEVAGEAGVDPALIRRAAAQLDARRDASKGAGFLGSPTEIVIERVVDAVIDVSEFDQLLDVTRTITHDVGEVSMVGRQFGWKGRLDGANTNVNVGIGDRQITLRVRVQLDEVALGQFMVKGTLFGFGGGLIGGGAAAALVGGAFGPIVWAGMLGSGYLLARRGLRRAAVNYRARANELIDALARRALDTAANK